MKTPHGYHIFAQLFSFLQSVAYLTKLVAIRVLSLFFSEENLLILIKMSCAAVCKISYSCAFSSSSMSAYGLLVFVRCE